MSGQYEYEKNIISATNQGAAVKIKPQSFLADNFETYRKAIRGSVFDPKSKSNIVPRHAWPTVAASLYQSGFEIDFDDISDNWIREEAERASKLTSEANIRLVKLKEAFRKRDLFLRTYQEDGVRWLADKHSGLLLDEQGTGKTIIAIAAIPQDVGVIIVCPASLRGLWRDELAKWRPELRTEIVINSFCRWPALNEVFITSESTIKQILSLRPWPILPSNIFLIADECMAFKSKSQRTAAMQELCAAIRRGNGSTIGMTGTPLMNHPSELFTISLVFGCMRLAFQGWGEYTKDWGCKKGRWGETIWGEPTSRIRENLSRVSIRRTRAEVLPELPPKTYQAIPVDIKARLYAQLNDLGEVMYPQLETWATSDKLPAFEKHSEVWNLLTHSKIDDMLDWCDRQEEANEPSLVFSMHLAPLARLSKRAGWAVITGESPANTRTEIVKAFQGGDLKGVALSIKAGGTGLTLTRAAFALFVDRSYNPADNLQAEDRVMRYGQNRPVQISCLVADHPLDRRIYEILQKKARMISKVVT